MGGREGHNVTAHTFKIYVTFLKFNLATILYDKLIMKFLRHMTSRAMYPLGFIVIALMLLKLRRNSGSGTQKKPRLALKSKNACSVLSEYC